MREQKRVELLAPAGNPEGFYGAICAGADAVYLGGDKFGARAYADNFTTQELVGCIRYAHIWGRRVYLTVNTLVKEKELAELYDYLAPFYEAGLDGVIVQDFGVFSYIREHFPGMELHVSTQMTLTGSKGAALLKELGACRIVPARELSLSEIRQIKADTGLEIEAFIHGAMCYCYSGQCLFSSILGGRSGNRGRCAQPCRLPYRITTEGGEGAECYPLSLKDMCTIEHIPELIEAGIDSFKIEGRMKKPEYAAGVTAIYRRAIDRYYREPSGDFRVSKKDMEALGRLYIRSERQDGYYYKHNGADMVTIDSPAYSGSDEKLLSELRGQYLSGKMIRPISIYAAFLEEQPASLTLICEDICVTVEGERLQKALKQPVTEENIRKQLGRLGDSCFEAQEIVVTLDEQVFCPLKAINELRRQAVEELTEKLIAENGLPGRRILAERQPERVQAKAARRQLSGGISTGVLSDEQLTAVLEYLDLNRDMEAQGRIRRVYLDCSLVREENEDRILTLFQLLLGEVFVTLPYIIRNEDEPYLTGLFARIEALNQKQKGCIAGCMVRSVEGYAYGKSLVKEGALPKLSSDAGFYLWNHRSLSEFAGTLSSWCLPYELNGRETKSLIQKAGELGLLTEKVVYGHIPMMITANCVRKTAGQCRGKDALRPRQRAFLTDRYQKRFPVLCDCRACMNVIYNSLPLSLHTAVSKWREEPLLCRLDFTVEDEQETKRVLSFFTALLAGREAQIPYGEYTTGHEKRGVE